MDRLLKQPTDQRSDSAGYEDSTASKRRGIVINWLDRLVERRIEKVERDITKTRKIADTPETH